AEESGSIEEALKDLKTLKSKLEVTLDGMIDTLDDVKKQKIVEKVGDITSNIRDITHALNVPDKWSGTLDNIHNLSGRALKSIDTLDISLNNATKITEDGKTLIANINSGEGTLGKILVRDDMYLQVKAILSKLNTVADDVNHYGILFHLDKNWKRLRARR